MQPFRNQNQSPGFVRANLSLSVPSTNKAPAPTKCRPRIQAFARRFRCQVRIGNEYVPLCEGLQPDSTTTTTLRSANCWPYNFPLCDACYSAVVDRRSSTRDPHAVLPHPKRSSLTRDTIRGGRRASTTESQVEPSRFVQVRLDRLNPRLARPNAWPTTGHGQ